MGALIDSSVLVAAERATLDLGQVLADRAQEMVAVAAITASELIHGVHRAASPAQRRRREAFVERLITRDRRSFGKIAGLDVTVV